MKPHHSPARLIWLTFVACLGLLLPVASVYWMQPAAHAQVGKEGEQESKSDQKAEPAAGKVAGDKHAADNPLSDLIKKLLPPSDKPASEKKQPGAAPAKKDAPQNAKDEAPKEEAKDADKENVAGKNERLITKKKSEPEKKAAPPARADRANAKGTDKKNDRNDIPGLDYIDSRAPQDKNLSKQYRRALAKIESQEWQEAMDVLQELLDETAAAISQPNSADSLVFTSKQEWVSLRGELIRLLGGLPAEQLELYRRQHTPKAAVLLREAKEHNAPGKYVEVATRFLHTESGHEAANHLGTLHFDRGQYGLASRWFYQLLLAKSPVTADPRWRVKAAFAFRKSGMIGEANKLRDSLSDATTPRPHIGGSEVDPGTLLSRAAPDDASNLHNPVVDDWTMHYGNPSRRAVVEGGEPLLVPRWSVPTTYSEELRRQTVQMLEDLRDADRTAISTFFPLMVGGKIVMRTLRGVEVIAADGGEVLWETRPDFNPEVLLTGNGEALDFPMTFPVAQGIGAMPWRIQMAQPGRFRPGWGDVENISEVDQNPLANLMLSNGTYGILSSDGRLLFVIEDQAIFSRMQPGQWDVQEEQTDPYKRSWSTNRLAAYDLETGRPVWEVGGPVMNEVFDPPLAGYYFFGAPVVEGNELFVAGEKEGEIRLLALDVDTGALAWSQVLAYADGKIAQDLGRRFYNSQIAVDQGVLVCPTTVGWLVAVDRVNRSLLWAYRYSKRQSEQGSRGRSTAYAQAQLIGRLWGPSAPIISGNKVVYTPSEEAEIYCLNLIDGTLAWKKPKHNFLYVAGVFGNKIVLVGNRSVAALNLDDGASLWNLPLPPEDGMPSGWGVAAGGNYYLPLQSGQLWSIDLESGKAAAKLTLPDAQQPLGNLSMYRGLLLSLEPNQLRAFEQRAVIESEIARLKQADPHNPKALLYECEMHTSRSDPKAALAALRAIRPEDLDADTRETYRRRKIDVLTALVQAEPAGFDDELHELDALSTSPDERVGFRRLEAQRAEKRAQYDVAFDLYWRLAIDDPKLGGTTITRADDSRISVGLDRWIAGRLADLWARLPAEAQQRVGERIAQSVDASLAELQQSKSPQRALDQLLYLGFHPASIKLRHGLADYYAAHKQLLPAENLLLGLVRHEDRAIAAAATLALARLLEQFDLAADAACFYDQLEKHFGDVTVVPRDADGQEAGAMRADAYVALLRERDGRQIPPVLPSLAWRNVELREMRASMEYYGHATVELNFNRSRLPFFKQHRFELDRTDDHRLNVTSALDDQLEWSHPVRRASSSGNDETISVASASGHQIMLFDHGMLHCLSPGDRKAYWSRGVEELPANQLNEYQINREFVHPLRVGATSIRSAGQLARQRQQSVVLAGANYNYVFLFGRRSFTIVDATTGQVRWTCNRIPRTRSIYCTDDVVYFVPQSRTEAVAFRALDGKPLEIANISKIIPRAIHIVGNEFVQVDDGPLPKGTIPLGGADAPEKSVLTIHSYDPLAAEDRWSVAVPTNTRMGLLPDGYLAAVFASGEMKLLDLESGSVQEFSGKFPDSSLKPNITLYAAADQDALYVVTSQGYNSTDSGYTEQLSSMPVNGPVYAFSRSSRNLMWIESVSKMNLIGTRLAQSPVLIFFKMNGRQSGELVLQYMTTMALDKTTGKKLIETTGPTNSGIESLRVNMAERFVEFNAYNERLRLIAVDRASDADAVEAPRPE